MNAQRLPVVDAGTRLRAHDWARLAVNLGAHVRRGDASVFAVQPRSVQGGRGSYRMNLRHGVSRVHNGHRYTLGSIFHDAT